MQRAKIATGRVVVCQQLGVHNAYTLETSLAGSSVTGAQFAPVDLERIGRSLCEAIAEMGDVRTPLCPSPPAYVC